MRYPLEEPFFVLATQNPIEMEGTYPLPEAQLDRFMFNVVIDYLPEDDEVAVVKQTTSRPAAADRAAVHRRGRAAVPRRRPPRADRRGRRPLRRAPGRREPARPAGDARLRQPVGELGRRPAGGAVPGAGRQGPRPARRPVARLARRHPRPRPLRRSATASSIGYRAEADGVSVETVIDRLLETVKAPHEG